LQLGHNLAGEHKPIWHELLAQAEAVEIVETAVRHRDEGVFHSWLITGPPGSGRSNLAFAFAAALQCKEQGCGTCQSCVLAKAGTHPDIQVLSTEKVQITIAEIRELVSASIMGSSVGRFRIMIIEDADRMTPTASNILLKALEEPPAGTLWILCAPSEVDMLPTIRSRVRRVGLKVPSIEDVAQLLITRDGIEPKLAHQVAAESQSHIGMARRLATSSEARARRKDTLKAAMAIHTVTDAVRVCDRWLDLAQKDADALTKSRDEEERTALLASMGLGPSDIIPPALRTEVKNLEEAQKRRAKRSLRDGLDRILVDLLALYRDVMTVQLAAAVPLVNQDLATEINDLANRTKPEHTIGKLEALELARHRIDRNVREQLVLDSLAVSLQVRQG
jgi:DNA polymerase-3 subunit delta'